MSLAFPRVRVGGATGRYATSENDAIVVPQTSTNRPAVIYCHGGGERPTTLLKKNGIGLLLTALADKGYPVYAGDFGTSTTGTTQADNWGNSNGRSRVADMKTWAQSNGARSSGKVILFGISMGWLTSVLFARANPTLVAGMVGVLPASSLAYLRDNNILGMKSSIEAAEGIASGDPLPANSDPTTASYAGITMPPSTVWYAEDGYGGDDTAVTPSTVLALAAIIGSTTHGLGAASAGHTDTSVAGVPIQQFLAVVDTYAEAA